MREYCYGVMSNQMKVEGFLKKKEKRNQFVMDYVNVRGR